MATSVKWQKVIFFTASVCFLCKLSLHVKATALFLTNDQHDNNFALSEHIFIKFGTSNEVSPHALYMSVLWPATLIPVRHPVLIIQMQTEIRKAQIWLIVPFLSLSLTLRKELLSPRHSCQDGGHYVIKTRSNSLCIWVVCSFLKKQSFNSTSYTTNSYTCCW